MYLTYATAKRETGRRWLWAMMYPYTFVQMLWIAAGIYISQDRWGWYYVAYCWDALNHGVPILWIARLPLRWLDDASPWIFAVAVIAGFAVSLVVDVALRRVVRACFGRICGYWGREA